MSRSARVGLGAGILAGVFLVYGRLLSAGFVGFDDDIHVYANPFLNPPTLDSLARLWQRSYEQLYVPLAYTLLGLIAHVAQVGAHQDASLGHAVSLAPGPFHAASLVVHLANTLLAFVLLQRLTRQRWAAWLAALVFALHPLQLESVGWISELRGLSSSCFALMALVALVMSRKAGTQARARALLAASAVLVACAMLCKPAVAALPLVALAIDRIALKTPWRKAIVPASIWAACTLPFAWLTHAVQHVAPSGQSLWWQRPFIAGDALTFYLFKLFLPVDLAVDYGRTPHSVMSQAWGYLAWVIPVILLGLAYRHRQKRPLTWLGALLFLVFLSPTLGLVPFAYQAHSTVADRYAYLALLGVGLMVADATDYVRSRRMAGGATVAMLVVLAALSLHQSRHWLTSADFLRHTVAVNPNAAFAYNNLGDIEQANGNYAAALASYETCVRRDPTQFKAYINLAEVHVALGEPARAQAAIADAIRAAQSAADPMTGDDLTNLGIVLMKMNQPELALNAFADATKADPTSPTYLYNQANALAALGRFDKAEATFRRCVALAPTLAGAHTGLGIVLAETGRLPEAADEFRAAVRLQPGDAAALDNLRRAESMLAGTGP